MGQNKIIPSELVKVTTDNTRMEAYVQILEKESEDCTYEIIMQELKANKIIYGIDESQIYKALEPQNRGKIILVAKGLSPEKGEDARLEYINTKPTVEEYAINGNVDYHNTGIINNVKKGDLLVRKIPCKSGIPGIDVTRKEIPAEKVKDIRIVAGKNTVMDDSGNCIYAGIDGHVLYSQGRVEVMPVYVIPGDVDYSTGNVDFIGSVVVGGTVRSGFKVKAQKDIEVGSIVESAELIAGGSISIKGGINGSSKGRVIAGESIYARFAENAIIEAGKDVIIKEAIIQSQVKAGACIKVSDKKAVIVGGILQAADSVESRILGSPLGTQTIVEVGVKPAVREQYHLIVKQYADKSKELQAISNNLQTYNQRPINWDNIDDKKKMALVKLLEYYQVLRQEVQELEKKIDALENEFHQHTHAMIKVADILYPGVRIAISDLIYTVNDPVQNALLHIVDGDIKLSSLK